MKPRTLLIGKRKRILSQLSKALWDEGWQASWSPFVETALKTYDPTAYDLVVTGRGIQLYDKKVLRERFETRNPAILFVDGLAPVIPLLVDQVKLAWAGLTRRKPVLSAVEFEQTEGGTKMHFQLEEPSSLAIALYRLNLLYRTSYEAITLNHIGQGHHDILFPSSLFGKRSPRFIVIKRGQEVLAAQAVVTR